MHQQQKRPQSLLMLDMNPDSLHTLSTDTSFCKLLFDDIKTLRFGGCHSQSWFPGIPSPDPHWCSVSLSGCHLWISSQSSIQSEKIGWSLTCHQCYKLSKILVQFFWGQKSPKVIRWREVTPSDVKMLNSLIVFLGFFNLGSERERGYAEPVWWHFGRD